MHAHIDFETRSAVDLKRTGSHRYAEDISTGVWCLSYAIGDGDIKTWCPGDDDPDDLLDHIENRGTVAAWNAAFEWDIWHETLPRMGCGHWPKLHIEQIEDTMARACCLALPAALGKCAEALGLAEQKDDAGRRLMLQMAKPRRTEDDGTLVWWDDPDKLTRLIEYCEQDVRTERAIAQRLIALTPKEQSVFALSHTINQRGLRFDLNSINKLQALMVRDRAKADMEIDVITGGEVKAVTAMPSLKRWLEGKNVVLPNLRAETIEEALADPNVRLQDDVHRALMLRSLAGGAAAKKLPAMRDSVSVDGRARGLFFYHGATTGRWSGRRVQTQNMKRPAWKHHQLDLLFEHIERDTLTLYMSVAFGDAHDVIPSCIRGMIIPDYSNDFLCADFSNIEGRTLAWLAGETWKLDAYRAYDAGTGPDLYKLAYARAFGLNDVDGVIDSQRQIGKVQELALGYQGGVGAFRSMAANYGITVLEPKQEAPAGAHDVLTTKEADEIKRGWREAHPCVVQLWRDCQDAAMNAVADAGKKFQAGTADIDYVVGVGFLWCRLPSGRLLAYRNPKIKHHTNTYIDADGEKQEITGPAVSYQSMKKGQWCRVYGYGGLFVENITQAVARDVLVDAMLRVEGEGLPVVMHVHDEILCEAPEGIHDLKEFETLMASTDSWAAGLPVVAEGWRGKRYRK